MNFLEQVADALAQDVLKVYEATGDESVITKVKNELSTNSSTLEEAYMTAIRVRRSEKRGRELLQRIKQDAGLD
ncbi:hypothetical protein [Aliiroseovarius crassostreae]|uniref:hypothetical protein n=1 Tax=Aliiroseovarius crassostreae TaxID=154981 RepID=UPI003C7DF368